MSTMRSRGNDSIETTFFFGSMRTSMTVSDRDPASISPARLS